MPSPPHRTSAAAPAPEGAAAAAHVEELLAPRDGPAPLLTTPESVARVAERIAGGAGPVAIDTERASGYRYYARAYLIQIRREGAGTALIDPIAAGPSQPLADALAPLEWILHSADQDLPCLAEYGLRPAALFDTELAGRLLGTEKVNLAAMVRGELGLHLAKGHGAADWSRRPLPEAWLNYAALDVEVLIELRESLQHRLRREGKREWALQEFEHVRTAESPPPDPERWRRTSGLHRVHSRRGLAAVRSLWNARDALASSLDRAPGRVLPDSALVDAARSNPRTSAELRSLKVFGGPRQRKRAHLWLDALDGARGLPDSELPSKRVPGAVPAAGRWRKVAPEAAERLAAARSTLHALSAAVDVPEENLLSPRVLKSLCWTCAGTAAPEAAHVDRYLDEHGARPWQRELTVQPLADALSAVFHTGSGTAPGQN